MTGFPSVRRLLAITALVILGSATTPATSAQQEPCPGDRGPGASCANGLWSPAKCLCECVPPFCRDEATGACTGSGHCPTDNPWADCALGADCPWWDNPRKEEACATGPDAPPGVYDLHASREVCCDVHHPFSSVCNPLDAPRPTSAPAPGYDLIPIRFAVSGLPEDVNMSDLKDEMMTVLRRVLTDVAESHQDLKVTKIEENLLLNAPLDDDGGGDGKREVYFDVFALRYPQKKFGPTIIAKLRDSYGELIEYFEHYTNMKYFGYGMDFFWCISDNENDEEDQTSPWGACSLSEEVVDDNFRLAYLPRALDVEKLTHQIALTFKSLLENIERLEIYYIEEEVVNVTTSDGVEGNLYDTKDIFFNIHLIQKYGISSFAPVVRDKLQRSAHAILDEIQKYTDTQTDLDLDWYLDAEGAYAVLKSEEEPQSVFPIWAIITLTAAGVVLLCCCFCFILYKIKKRDEYYNEQNMVIYLNPNYSAPNRRKRTRPRRQRYESRQQQPPPRRRKRPRVDHSRSDHGRSRPRSRKPERHGETPSTSYRRRLKNYRSEVNDIVQSPRRHAAAQQQEHPVPRKDTEYQLANMKSFVFAHNGDGHPPPLLATEDIEQAHRGAAPRERPVPRKDTEYELENMPTFVFDHGDDGEDRGPPLFADEGDGRSRRLAPAEHRGEKVQSFVFPKGDGQPSPMLVMDDDDGRYDEDRSTRRPDPEGEHANR